MRIGGSAADVGTTIHNDLLVLIGYPSLGRDKILPLGDDEQPAPGALQTSVLNAHDRGAGQAPAERYGPFSTVVRGVSRETVRTTVWQACRMRALR